jgi:serine/threonine protein kinase
MSTDDPKKQLPFSQLGPYAIKYCLGSGGMGAVYFGVDETNGQRAAIKVLSQSLAMDRNFRRRFGAEIETLKKLKHPNIVELLGYGEQEGFLFYVMEMVEGRTLQGELQAGHCFDWQQTARIGVEICQALKHAHDRGVIHRDLKPANLLFSKDEHVKLADFGIAKLYGMAQMTAAGGVLGTADYMAPEQAESKPVTARSDLYSLGSVLFSLLAGRPPFIGRSVPEVLRKLTTEDAPPVRRFAPHTPREFELLIAQLLEKDPQQRIATALATGNRLKAMAYALSQETRVTDTPHEPPPPSSSTPQRVRSVPPDGLTRSPDSVIHNVDFDESAFDRHDDSTMSASDLRDAATSDDEGPGEDTAGGSTHFTTYDEAARLHDTYHASAEESTPLWLKIAPLVLGVVAIAALIWYATRPVTADALYKQIMAAAESTETQSLATVETEMQQFLQLFPGDDRGKEIKSLLEELNLYRLERRYRRRARFRSGIDSLTVPERAYVAAIRFAEDDPFEALVKLRALVDVYSGMEQDDDIEKCLRLAAEQIASIEERAKTITAENLDLINQRLDAADAIEATDSVKANTIRQGIISLYQNEPWADAAVQRARQAIDQASSG